MRRFDRLVSLLLGLALAAAGVVAGIEIMLLVLGEPSLVILRGTWDHDLSTLRWSDPSLETVAGVLIGVGAVLTLLQLIPRRKIRLLLARGTVAGTWLSRKSLTRKVTYDVGELPGVDRVTSRVGRRHIRVRARLAPGVAAEDGRALVAGAVDALLAAWALHEPLRVKVQVSTTQEPVDPGERSHGHPAPAARVQ